MLDCVAWIDSVEIIASASLLKAMRTYFSVWPLKLYKALAINCGLFASRLARSSSSSLHLLATSASYSRLSRSSSSSLRLCISSSAILLSSSSFRLHSSSSSSLRLRAAAAASSSLLLEISSSDGGFCWSWSSSDAVLAEP